MAHVARVSKGFAPWTDCRGAVYVEFLIAFFPVFLLFLATCQVALLTTARIAVSHAAVAAVRSAIVVLEDPSGDYDGAPFGSLSEGRSSNDGDRSLMRLVRAEGHALSPSRSAKGGGKRQKQPQEGARMAPVRLAATIPLLTLAPNESSIDSANRTVEHAVSSSAGNLGFAFAYTSAAAAITVHSSESDNALATEPLAPTQNVTVRVAYLYRCAVPLVRTFMCRSLPDLFGTEAHGHESPATSRLRAAGAVEHLKQWVPVTERFTILTGMASLPNQGTHAIRESTQ